MADTATVVAEFWDKNVGAHREPFQHAESSNAVADFINFHICGHDKKSPFVDVVEQYGPFPEL